MKHAAIGFWASSVIFFSCLDKNSSNLKGHFEKMSSEESMRLAEKLKPKVSPEYETTDAVILSGSLFRPNERDGFYRPDIASEILATGTKVIVVHEKGKDADSGLYDEFLSSMKALGYSDSISFVASQSESYMTSWARDWAPLSAETVNAERALLDFNYYPARANDDHAPQWLASSLADTTRISVPIYNEGGNFMINSSGVCIMTEAVIDRNSEEAWKRQFWVDENGDPIITEYGYFREYYNPLDENTPEDKNARVVYRTVYYDLDGKEHFREDDIYLNKDQLTDYFKKYSGCQKVIFLPKMPFEGTGHVDMFAKFISNETILLAEISSEQLKFASGKNLKIANSMKKHLEKVREILEAEGFSVIGLPAPLAQNVNDVWGPYTLVRSYTNSLLVINRNGQKVALVPSYKKMAAREWDEETQRELINQPYIDDALLTQYESKVEQVYQGFGYKVKFINSDDLIAKGGAVHCVTMQINKSSAN